MEDESLERNPQLTPAIFEILFKFISKAFSKHQQADVSGQTNGGNRFREKLSLLGESSAERLGGFFLASHAKSGATGLSLPHVMHRTVEVLRTPLRLKYRCFRDTDWRTSINVLLKILKKGKDLQGEVTYVECEIFDAKISHIQASRSQGRGP